MCVCVFEEDQRLFLSISRFTGQISNMHNFSWLGKSWPTHTTQKMKFSAKDFFSKCDQIRRKLRISSHLLKKSLAENFIFVQGKDIFSRPWGSKYHTDMKLWPLTSLCKRNIMPLRNLAMTSWWQIMESYSIPRFFLNLDPIWMFNSGSAQYNKSSTQN